MIFPASMLLLLFQVEPLDPKSYAASWGVLGALVFVIVIMAGVIWKVFVSGADEARKRTDAFMAFTKDHADHHAQALSALGEKIREGDERQAQAMNGLGDKIRAGDERLAQAFEANARMNRAVLVTWEAIARARALKSGGGALTSSELDVIIRAAHETVHRGVG